MNLLRHVGKCILVSSLREMKEILLRGLAAIVVKRRFPATPRHYILITRDTGRSWRALVFPCIMALQKLANHLTILIPQDEVKADRAKWNHALDLFKQAVPQQWDFLYRNRKQVEILANPDFCGKWKILKELLSLWYNNKDKVLVFSHSVRLLHILESLFKKTSYNVSFLSGGQKVTDRQKEVDDFNSDPEKFVFLISTKAGGVGLNITSANKVVIFDPHWNPAYVRLPLIFLIPLGISRILHCSP